jgi:hypothetical protein
VVVVFEPVWPAATYAAGDDNCASGIDDEA